MAVLAVLGTALLTFTPRPAEAQESVWQRTSATGTGGVALGGEHDFIHVKLTVPVAVSNRWAVGPSVAAFSEFGDGEGTANEDRFATGVEARYNLAGIPSGPVLAYVGVRGMYSFSEDEGSGPYGGVLAGVQYALEPQLAIGLEGQALRDPEGEFLFAPAAAVTVRF